MKTMSTMKARLGAVLAGLALLLAGLTAQAGTITYFHNDLAGSPLVATNEQGQVIWRENYRPYGERLVNSAAASGNAVWFTSRRQDAESGLVYMGARHYDPVAGRFVSMDPVGFDEGNIHSFNRYAYANNNPYRYVDPDGRSPVLLLRLFGGGAIGGTAGAAADAVSQYAAFGSIDWGMASQSNAALEGAAAGALSFLPSGTPVGLSIKAVGEGAAKGAREGLGFTRSQLQHAFKHAEDFGVTGTANNRTLADFSSALQSHVDAIGTRAIQGTYRGNSVTHHVDPGTGLNVIRDSSGSFLSGWRLSPQQLEHVLTTGKLGGS